MNFYYFISNKLSKPSEGKSFSSIVSKIAVISVAVGVTIMILSFSILEGFRGKIYDKIFSFAGHIQVTAYDFNRSYEASPIAVNHDFIDTVQKQPLIKSIYIYSLKAGLFKTDDEVMGTLIKGVDKDFDTTTFNQNLKEGRFIRFNDTAAVHELVISRKMADKLKLKIGDEVVLYFIQDPPRYRKLEIVGIYRTGMEDFDEMYTFGDIKMIRRLNDWNDSLAGGYEIFVNEFDKLSEAARMVFHEMDSDLALQVVKDKYIHIFDWLILLDRNVNIFLGLILIVACFNIVSTNFIMIMERTSMIGLFKALGANNGQIMKIFMYNGVRLVLKGLLWGNLIGLGLCFIQDRFNIISLDPENYYMDHVPVAWNFLTILGINIIALVIISTVIIIPAMLISRIQPIRAIKFE